MDPAFCFWKGLGFNDLNADLLLFNPIYLQEGSLLFPMGAHAVTGFQTNRAVWTGIKGNCWVGLEPFQSYIKILPIAACVPQIVLLPSLIQHLGEPKLFPWVGVDQDPTPPAFSETQHLPQGHHLPVPPGSVQGAVPNSGHNSRSWTWCPLTLSRSHAPSSIIYPLTDFLTVPFLITTSSLSPQGLSSSVFSSQADWASSFSEGNTAALSLVSSGVLEKVC